VAGILLAACGKTPPLGEKSLSLAAPDAAASFKQPLHSQPDSLPEPENSDPRLPFPVLFGEYTLALPPSFLDPVTISLEQDAADSLHNLVLAPEDWENGWGWAWDVFRAMPPELRSSYIDKVASVTPAWAWGRLDPILNQPGWGPDVLHALYNRMLGLPMSEQLPRLLRIAKNRTHPCWEQADSLLQAYFPDIESGNYKLYQRHIDSWPSL